MEIHDAWFFIGVFVFIFLIWIATGGPLHPIAFTGPSLSLPGQLGGGTYLSLPRSPYDIGTGNSVVLPGSSNGGSVSGSSGTSASSPSPLGGIAFGAVSPYRGIVSLTHYVSGAGSSNPGNEYVVISVSPNAGVPVDLSEWTLQSDASGNAVVIPKGTRMPTSGIVNAAQDIILNPGEQAIVISGQSPIGASFEENKCIGYFSTFQKFSPPLPQNCPAPNNELISFYGTGYIRDAACIDYVNTLSRCQVALTPPVGASSACQSFVATYLNYNGCINTHKNDTDFKSATWRVYLGRTNAMWRTQHEVVKLLDATG
ncbi:MAG: hypothetical protein B7W98_03540, partial [Parcubacteria group bacterium 20-58-5]